MQDLRGLGRRPAGRPVQITRRDRDLLGFAAVHRVVLAAHARALAGASADSRLRALAAAGMLKRECIFHRQPPCYLITPKGLAVTDSGLPPPTVDLRSYQHDIGVAWLWLAARAGRWGPIRQVLAERELRSRDGVAEGRPDPLAVRLGGVGPAGRERLHYPDLLLRTREGLRIALELELSGKGRGRRERILAGYGADARFAAVLYLAPSRSVARRVLASAAELGIGDRVHVQLVHRPGTDRELRGATLARPARRAPVREPGEGRDPRGSGARPLVEGGRAR